ncbi:hypothetical protein P175DRAFT_0531123 [Aspergillus ochraceoroseus IBT 24754]|uniref:Zn(2)-C6 fungal-type domain-containing protein n=1 Tax=Aspergillus ochraceoroseus IBT 24754 TaxID=1392256 RepID=A0A2T5LZA0_9EURO|nr:uncharacterized protein P175DRAFT_0531123 [Aspergillus ochraceoroseus IBT 24754]PTU21604.1 hypothetical protein P175DRAFT_0531123 [Aspergillus ochraceoroseus IBT 24754]
MTMMLAACEPCRLRKRKCDRLVPTCSLCKKRSGPCFYATPYRQIRAQEVENQLMTVADSLQALDRSQDVKLWETANDRIYYAWAICSPEASEPYPIASRWYMPRLIRLFCEGLGLSRVPVDAKSTAYTLQTVWVQKALGDPCLFHATLFAGSSYFDILRGEKQNPITIYHQNEVIRRINERLSDPVLALDDRTIASVAPLALFADLNNDRAAADAHLSGLQKMVELRGGLHKLGLDGVVATLMEMNRIVYMIAFDPEWGFSSTLSSPAPLGLEHRALNTSAPKNPASEADHAQIQSLFQWVSNIKEQVTLHGAIDPTQAAELPPPSQDPIHGCCYLAAMIFRHLVDMQPYNVAKQAQLDALARDLRASLALTEDERWLRDAPAALIWTCITGAAACADSRTRVSFYFKQASAVRLLNRQHDLSVLEDIWNHYSWLRGRRLTPLPEAYVSE